MFVCSLIAFMMVKLTLVCLDWDYYRALPALWRDVGEQLVWRRVEIFGTVDPVGQVFPNQIDGLNAAFADPTPVFPFGVVADHRQPGAGPSVPDCGVVGEEVAWPARDQVIERQGVAACVPERNNLGRQFSRSFSPAARSFLLDLDVNNAYIRH